MTSEELQAVLMDAASLGDTAGRVAREVINMEAEIHRLRDRNKALEQELDGTRARVLEAEELGRRRPACNGEAEEVLRCSGKEV